MNACKLSWINPHKHNKKLLLPFYALYSGALFSEILTVLKVYVDFLFRRWSLQIVKVRTQVANLLSHLPATNLINNCTVSPKNKQMLSIVSQVWEKHCLENGKKMTLASNAREIEHDVKTGSKYDVIMIRAHFHRLG